MRKLRPRERHGFVLADIAGQWQSWDRSQNGMTAASEILLPCPHFYQSTSFPLHPSAFQDVRNSRAEPTGNPLVPLTRVKALCYREGRCGYH